MDAYIALLLDREQFDSELTSIQGAFGDLTATIPVRPKLPRAIDLVPPAPTPAPAGQPVASSPYRTVAEATSLGIPPMEGMGFDWAGADNAPSYDEWQDFFNSWRNRGDDSRFKARGGIFGENVGEGIDYGEVFMHMSSRTMESWNEKIFGSFLADLEDKIEEPAFLAASSIAGGPLLGASVLQESKRQREEGEREYRRWLDREALPENQAGLLEGIMGSGKAIVEEAQHVDELLKIGFADEAEISSPSKKTHTIGGLISTGAAEGIRSGIPTLRQYTKQVIDQSFTQAAPRVKAKARSGQQLIINNQYQNVSAEMQAEIKRGVDQAMRFLRIPRARA